MENVTERLDLLILGATGFTGKHTVKNLVNIIKKSTDLCNVTWGIAARSKEKIQNLLLELEDLGEEKNKIPVIECDIQKADLREVTRRAKILINCTGPNTVLSEPIVKACVATKTHYVDISAELYHMINLYRGYNQAAEEANTLVVPACGFAVVPATAALMYLEDNFKGTLNTVESYVEIIIPKRAYFPGKCLVHYGTWASLVHELQNFQAYRRLKMETFPRSILDPEPPGFKRCFFHRNKGRFWFPYPGPDEDMVEMSQRYLCEQKEKKPYHFKMYTTTPLFIHMLLIVPAMFIYYNLSRLSCFRNLLWKYPKVFTLGYLSHKGPSEKMAQDTKFEMTFTGKGVDEKQNEKSMSVKISGADPGYETTALTLLACAITMLTEPQKMPKGGVLSIGAAFEDTQLVNRLIEHKALVFDKLDK